MDLNYAKSKVACGFDTTQKSSLAQEALASIGRLMAAQSQLAVNSSHVDVNSRDAVVDSLLLHIAQLEHEISELKLVQAQVNANLLTEQVPKSSVSLTSDEMYWLKQVF